MQCHLTVLFYLPLIKFASDSFEFPSRLQDLEVGRNSFVPPTIGPTQILVSILFVSKTYLLA